MAADHANAVILSAGLTNNVLSAPAIGTSASFSTGFDDGTAAQDVYVSVGTETSPPTYLTPVIASGAAWALVINPVASVNVDVTLYACVGAAYTALGVLPSGGMALVPLQAGTRLGASVAAATQNVGVSFTATVAN